MGGPDSTVARGVTQGARGGHRRSAARTDLEVKRWSLLGRVNADRGGDEKLRWAAGLEAMCTRGLGERD